jgi:sugar phosphate isomerase/epimerase
MARIKYSYNTLVYAGEDIADSIARLAKYGYDGVDFVGEPETMNVERIKTLLTKHKIEASSICGIYTPERDLVSSNENIRGNAVTYIKQCTDFASAIGAKSISVAPTACMRIHPEADIKTEWAWAVGGIRDAGRYAGNKGIRLTVEPWNRYETYLVNRLEQSLAMVNEVDLPNVGCMGDTFHMNLEEKDISEAFRLAGKKLYYVHIADSNRAAPGRGHIDFSSIAKALKEIDYQGYVSMELFPAAADPFMLLKGGRCEEFYDQYTRESIEYLKKLF